MQLGHAEPTQQSGERDKEVLPGEKEMIDQHYSF